MQTSYFLPGPDDQRDSWDINFAAKLPRYASKYGISNDEVKAVQEGSAWFSAVLEYQRQFVTFGNTVTAYKNALRDGLEKGATLSPLTIPAPVLPGTEAPVGVFRLVAALADRIKSHENYSEADGNDLGIVGTPIAPPNPATLMPDLAVTRGTGGHPELRWHKQNMPLLEICVDRGLGAGWEKLDTSDQARYTDTHALPPAGTSAVWRYKAIYKQKGAQIGQWCEPVSVSVMG